MTKRAAVIVATTLLGLGVTGGVVLAHTAEQRASLSASSVSPGPGDPDGSGRATIRSAPSEGIVCYKLFFKGIGKATAAHVHKAPKGQAGPTHMKLFTSKKGKSAPAEGCHTGIPVDVIEAMHNNPDEYYVDLHTKAYPDGALRGQLRNSK
jgi:hypothetical protein